MSRQLTVLIAQDQLPGRERLQDAISKLKFKLSLDDDYAPMRAPGYLPCTLDGEDAGFDLRFEAGSGGEIAVQLRWGGDPREQAAALIVAAGFALCCPARLFSAGSEAPQDGSALAERARRLLEEI